MADFLSRSTERQDSAAWREGRARAVPTGSAGESFGKLLRRLRDDAGLTQEELAEAASVSARSISDLERGINSTARKDTARLLAGALGLTGTARAAFEAAARGRPAAPQETQSPGAPPITRTLPRDVARFTGRDAELATLVDSVATTAAWGAVIGIYAIDGMAGVGKTALAVHAAHRLAKHFPDGQLFLSLHAHTPGQPPVDPADALASLLMTAGIPAAQIPPGRDARMARWRDLLADKKLLLVLDDAADHEQVRPLLPSGGGSAVLVTSRRHLTALEDATAISLDIMPPDKAALLFVALANRPGVTCDDPEVADITRLCGYLPLAIGITARQLHHHAAWTAADLAADFGQARDRLELLQAENVSVAAAFDLSYQELTPDQQLFFRRISLSPGEDVDAYAAAAVASVSLAVAQRELAALYDNHLVFEPARHRYRLHDLLRAHARALTASDPREDNQQAVSRLLAYYRHAATVADRHLAPYTSSAVAEQPPPMALPVLRHRDQALAWLVSERGNLLACISHASALGDGAQVIGLTAAIAHDLRRRGPWTTAAELHTAAMRAARNLGDAVGEASARMQRGAVLQLTGDYAGAERDLRSALEMYRDLDDGAGQAKTLHQIAEVQRLRSDYQAAADTARQAAGMFQELGDRRGQARVLCQLGKVLCVTDDYPGAAAILEQAVQLGNEAGDLAGEATALCELGIVRYATDDYDQAIACLERSLELSQEADDRWAQAYPLLQLGVVRDAMDDYPAAMTAFQRALVIYTEFGNKLGIANVWSNIGSIRRTTGDYAGATAALERALNLYGQIGHRLGLAHATHEKAVTSYLTGNIGAAAEMLAHAHDIYLDVGHEHGRSTVLRDLGVVSQLTGDQARAARLFNEALGICRRLGDRLGEARSLTCLGNLEHASGNITVALSRHRDALAIARAIHSQLIEAQALEGIGRCRLSAGDAADGYAALRLARVIYVRIGAAEAGRLAVEFAAGDAAQ